MSSTDLGTKWWERRIFIGHIQLESSEHDFLLNPPEVLRDVVPGVTNAVSQACTTRCKFACNKWHACILHQAMLHRVGPVFAAYLPRLSVSQHIWHARYFHVTGGSYSPCGGYLLQCYACSTNHNEQTGHMMCISVTWYHKWRRPCSMSVKHWQISLLRTN
jgi:hypothetical protein